MHSSGIIVALLLIIQIGDGTCCWPSDGRTKTRPTPTRKSLDWVKSVEKTGSCGHQIDVTLTVQCRKAWTHRPNDTELSQLCGLLKTGINKYWSRSIQRGGITWDVSVHVTEATSGDRKTIIIKTYKTNPWLRFTSRSHNSGILTMTMKYLQYEDDPDNDFKETAAHEIGHSFLHKAKGMKYSWTHKGSSTFLQSRYNGTEDYPITGEIDLMKYYRLIDQRKRPSDFYSRVKAAEEDVLLLLGLADITTNRE